MHTRHTPPPAPPHASGRPHTQVDAGFRAELVAGTRPLHRATSQDCWLLAKERQRLEDGTAARIEPDRLDRLAALPSHWPGAKPAKVVTLAEAPMVSGHDTSEIDAARQAALPATRAAIARILGRGPSGDDAA